MILHNQQLNMRNDRLPDIDRRPAAVDSLPYKA